MSKLRTLTRTVLSYCDIPEKISGNHCVLREASCDTYVEHRVTPKDEQKAYDHDNELDNWIIKTHPDLEGRTILIHIDY